VLVRDLEPLARFSPDPFERLNHVVLL
jgi:hypothetical protein